MNLPHSQGSQKDPLNLLIVDDNESDIEIARIVFEGAQIKNKLFALTDTEVVFDFLDGIGRYQDRQEFPKPDLILLDIRMPKLDGIDLLKKIKAHPIHGKIPVIMFTSSRHPKDVSDSYSNGASTYLQKPVGYQEFMKMTDHFNAYWQMAALERIRE